MFITGSAERNRALSDTCLETSLLATESNSSLNKGDNAADWQVGSSQSDSKEPPPASS